MNRKTVTIAAATRAIFVSRRWCDFFQILSCRLRARVATLGTNFGDKLKAARIAYLRDLGTIDRHSYFNLIG